MSAEREREERETWIDALLGLYVEAWAQSNIVVVHPGLGPLARKFAEIAAVEAERLVVAERAFGPSIAEGLPIPWGQVVVGGE